MRVFRESGTAPESDRLFENQFRGLHRRKSSHPTPKTG